MALTDTFSTFFCKQTPASGALLVRSAYMYRNGGATVTECVRWPGGEGYVQTAGQARFSYSPLWGAAVPRAIYDGGA